MKKLFIYIRNIFNLVAKVNFIKFPFRFLKYRNATRNISFSKKYYAKYMNYFNYVFGFEGKIVAEIGAGYNLQCSQAAAAFGAEIVYAVDPNLTLPNGGAINQRIKVIKSPGENVSEIKSNELDLAYGMAFLEHVSNPSGLAMEIARILKPGGKAIFQGSPLWTSWNGHHLYFTAKSGNRYIFNSQNFNFIEPWEHLTFPSKEKFKQVMLAKNIPDQDIDEIYFGLYEDQHISRLSVTEIIKAFNIPEFKIDTIRLYSSKKKNNSYMIANKYYSKKDLTTTHLFLIITKK